MDETIEEDVVEEIKEQITEEPIKAPMVAGQPQVPTVAPGQSVQSAQSQLSFNDIDFVKTEDGNMSTINAPKDLETLEQISEMRYQQRKLENEEEDNDKISISDQSFQLDTLDIHNIEEPRLDLLPDLLIDDIEVLE
jgi:hypothetical protein